MRGRLIIPFLAEIAQLDTAATEAAGGYDPVWRTMTVRNAPDGTTVDNRRDKLIRLKCQIEPITDAQQHQGPGGDLPISRVDLVFHYIELEELGLIDPNTGQALIRKNDRLVAIYDRYCQLVRRYPDKPPLTAQQVQDREFGLGGASNLLLVTFQDRPQGVR